MLVPKMDYTAWPEAKPVMSKCGLSTMPYQDVVMEGLMAEYRKNWAAAEVVVFEPRQNGKGVIGESRVVAGVALFEEDLIFWTAQLVPTALEGMKRILQHVTANDDLRKEVKKISNVNGRECIEFYGLNKASRITEPRRVVFVARTKDGGRGFAGAKVIIYDEAYKLTPDQMSATMPTLGTVENSQILYLSTPPLDTPASGPRTSRDATPGLHMFDLRKRARAKEPNLAYYNWGLDLDLDALEVPDPDTGKLPVNLDDKKLWYRMNPALGQMLQMRPVERERASMTDRAFARERLGAWPVEPADPKDTSLNTLNPKAWMAARRTDLVPGDTVVFGVDSDPNRTGCAITAYWVQPDGMEAAEQIIVQPGIGWLPQVLFELKQDFDPLGIAFDAKSQIGANVGDLKAVGFQVAGEGPMREPQWGDMWIADVDRAAAATTGAVEAINSGRVVHGGQREMNIAVASVKMRDIGEGLQAFGRKASSSNIAPINAWALARQCWKEWHGTVGKYDALGSVW